MFAELHVQDSLGQGISTYPAFYKAIYFFPKDLGKKRSNLKMAIIVVYGKWELIKKIVF